ncbi:carboxypeptidase N subunit 2 [Pteropus alecto]|nr:carboxypeptidase N subunit 2 [Pteropus alecto]
MLPGAWLRWACFLLLTRLARPCPVGCDCFVQEVFCSDEEMAAIPLDIPPHATDIVFVETSFTTVKARAFGGSPNLTKVVFLNTQLYHLEPDAFGGLPRLWDLEVTGSAFSNLSADSFSNLTSLGQLTLNFNMLDALPESLFHHMDALESLQLQGNRLQILPVRLFQPLKRLRTLNLAQNLLAQLPEELFEPLSSLHTLKLSNNALSGLPQRVFAKLGSLKELFLDGNSISELPSEVFSQLFNLEKLWLQRNAIRHLPPSIFSSLGKLTYLNLQGNALQMLPAGLFAHSPGLVGLSLSHNQLKTVTEGAFANLSSLSSLTLSHNAITHLPAGIFRDLEELIKLYLGSNNLTALHSELFQNLSKLELLSLSRNLLTTLPEGIFDTNYNLFNLALHGNPWQCDCHLAYLFSWLHQYSDRLFNIQTYCAGPAYLKGQVVPALKEEQLVCPVTRDHLGFQAPRPEDREPGDSWDLAMEEKVARSWCTYSNPEGTVVLSCDKAQCRWLNVQLSPRQDSGSPGLMFNASQEWDLKSSCGSVKVTLSIEAQTGEPQALGVQSQEPGQMASGASPSKRSQPPPCGPREERLSSPGVTKPRRVARDVTFRKSHPGPLERKTEHIDWVAPGDTSRQADGDAEALSSATLETCRVRWVPAPDEWPKPELDTVLQDSGQPGELSIQDNGTKFFWKRLELETMNLESNLDRRLLSYAFFASVKRIQGILAPPSWDIPSQSHCAMPPSQEQSLRSELLTALRFCQILLNQEAGYFS